MVLCALIMYVKYSAVDKCKNECNHRTTKMIFLRIVVHGFIDGYS